MMDVLKTEWLKMRSYWAFWGVMAMTALSYPGINYIWWNIYQEVVQKQSTTGTGRQNATGQSFCLS